MGTAQPPQEAQEARIRGSAAQRERVRGLVLAGRRWEAEPDEARARGYRQRPQRRRPVGAEAIQGDSADIQSVAFLTAGAQARRAVAFLEVGDPRGSTLGTGFLISPSLLITNQHVLRDSLAAAATQVVFDREFDTQGRAAATTTYSLDPQRCALFAPSDGLDYAVVALGERRSGSADSAELGYCPLSGRGDKHVLGMPVNIIHHPLGQSKMITVRNNLLTARTELALLYETDTETGSSGAPVFNDEWQVVALHHWGQPQLARGAQGAGSALVNEGIRISAIVADLLRRRDKLSPAGRSLLEHALALGVTGTPEAHSPSSAVIVAPSTREEHSMEPAPMNGAVRIVLPLEITVRFAGSETPVVASLPAAAAAPAGPAPRRTLSSGPEARRPDSNYAGRPGYRPNFLPDHPLALPRPTAALAEQIAPLRAGEPAAETGELRYQHFSVVMHRLRRVALFTATNIDGASYLAIDRASGRPAAEGDTWYHDQRISRAFTLGQEFYSEWSDYFDRGHLTRRSDPTWGSPEEAMRANADTFHFTNCAPQHFRFNQAAKYWQGAERYVLENGLLATDAHAARLSVFQGPIFDERRDRWADDVQIPSAFFKVVVWRGRDRLRAVGLLVDQVALLDEPRRFLGTPRDLPAVEVGQWRTAIARIGDLSGLVFDPAILAADTIQRAGQPQVGAEAAVPLRSFDDLRDICA